VDLESRKIDLRLAPSETEGMAPPAPRGGRKGQAFEDDGFGDEGGKPRRGNSRGGSSRGGAGAKGGGNSGGKPAVRSFDQEAAPRKVADDAANPYKGKAKRGGNDVAEPASATAPSITLLPQFDVDAKPKGRAKSTAPANRGKTGTAANSAGNPAANSASKSPAAKSGGKPRKKR
jgi:ribonuclease R